MEAVNAEGTNTSKNRKTTEGWKPLARNIGKAALFGFVGGAASLFGSQAAQAVLRPRGGFGKTLSIRS